MSGSELADLEALLMRVLADPSAFGHRLMEQILGRVATTPQQPPATVPGEAAPGRVNLHDALLDRDILLAAALGACECWGAELDCPLCTGHGGAGWRIPDKRLYDEFVAPAVARRREATDAQGPTEEAEGRVNAHDMAGQH